MFGAVSIAGLARRVMSAEGGGDWRRPLFFLVDGCVGGGILAEKGSLKTGLGFSGCLWVGYLLDFLRLQ